MPEMTTHERVKRMYEHREADRVPVTDSAWSSTIRRWRKEGLPEGVGYEEYFNLDRFGWLEVDNSPQYPVAVVEETDEYVVKTTNWGVTLRNWKRHGGTPEFLDFTVKTPDDWAMAKKRMTPSRDRVDWKGLKESYPKWIEQGAWTSAGFYFGFDVTHSLLRRHGEPSCGHGDGPGVGRRHVQPLPGR